VTIELKFYDSIHILSNSYKSQPIRFKISLFDINRTDCEAINETKLIVEEKDELDLIEISVMNESECIFKQQQPNGRLYNPKEFILFRTKIKQINTMVLHFFHSLIKNCFI